MKATFRTRLVVAASITSVLALCGAFTAVFVAVVNEHEREVDVLLVVEGTEEAAEIARSVTAVAALEDEPAPGLVAIGVGPLHKYAVLYGEDGNVRARSRLVGEAVPRLPDIAGGARAGEPFDARLESTRVRAIVVPIPGHPGERLLFGVSREPLDWDGAFLRRAMTSAFIAALVWSVAMTAWLVRRMTREHTVIAGVARRVAAGDLSARVGGGLPHADIAQLGRDVDHMIERLGALVVSQQQFVSYAAHELRSPITAVYGELANALRKERDVVYYREAIENALDATRRLNALVEDLLAFARARADIDRGRTKLASLAAMARVAMGDLRARAESAGVSLELEGDAVARTSNERDLERLVHNLVDNAIKHAPAGTEVRVAIAPGELSVADAGPGVPSSDRERIFEPFVRGAREAAFDGTGLGLAIVRTIARAHGGDVSIDSSHSPGARFVVRLPAEGA